MGGQSICFFKLVVKGHFRIKMYKKVLIRVNKFNAVIQIFNIIICNNSSLFNSEVYSFNLICVN